MSVLSLSLGTSHFTCDFVEVFLEWWHGSYLMGKLRNVKPWTPVPKLRLISSQSDSCPSNRPPLCSRRSCHTYLENRSRLGEVLKSIGHGSHVQKASRLFGKDTVHDTQELHTPVSLPKESQIYMVKLKKAPTT